MEKIWLKQYPPGIPENIDPDQYASLVEVFEKYTQKYEQLPAFSNYGTVITFQELYENSRALAAFFQQQWRLKKGDHLAIMMPNVLQYPVTVFAALMAGLVIVNINPLYTTTELIHHVNDSNTHAIVVLENFAHTVAAALPQTSLKQVMIAKMGDLMGNVKGPMMNFTVRYILRMVPKYYIPQTVGFKSSLIKGRSQPLNKVDLSGNDIAFLQYTGGTTGAAKGAMLSHRNMIANLLQCKAWVGHKIEAGIDIAVAPLPFYHIFALSICSLCFVMLGAKCLLITNPRDIKSFIKILKKNSPSVFIGINTLFNGLLNNLKFSKLDFSKLKLTIAGGMPVQKAVADKWQHLTSTPIIEGYGLTEASPVVTINPLDVEQFNESIGLPIPSTEIAIRDQENHDLTFEQAGELCVKGPQVMMGYWGNHGETSKVIDEEGWLHTGDIARVDEKGFIYIVDRKKDMVLVSGFNVYPNEVEEVIAKEEGVKEVAVIGIPSEKTGEAVKAFIVKKDPNLDEKKIIEHCRKYLTGYKIPKFIEFRDELPKSNVGKVLRKKLKEDEHIEV